MSFQTGKSLGLAWNGASNFFCPIHSPQKYSMFLDFFFKNIRWNSKVSHTLMNPNGGDIVKHSGHHDFFHNLPWNSGISWHNIIPRRFQEKWQLVTTIIFFLELPSECGIWGKNGHHQLAASTATKHKWWHIIWEGALAPFHFPSLLPLLTARFPLRIFDLALVLPL